jgi:glucosamine--fructose-6-phosphate aminotransferase (isomerizing)
MNSYLADILAQPQALRRSIAQFPHPAIEQVQGELRQGKFDRVVLTGMGASFNAAYPAFIQLNRLPLPVSLINSAELSHYLSGSLGEHTLCWLNSQSGRSIELTNLITQITSNPVARSLSFTNDENSPLALGADLNVHIRAGIETTVSTKTYTTMLAANLLSAVQLTGEGIKQAVQELQLVANAMETYLEAYETTLTQIERLLGIAEHIFILGRGPSLSTAWNGSLMCKEAAKFPAEGMLAADFRHGHIELVSKEVTVLFIEGDQKTAELNRDFAEEIARLNGNVLWVGADPHPILPTLKIPEVPERFLPLVEILPMQLLSIVLATRHGIQAGDFQHIQKVTLQE